MIKYILTFLLMAAPEINSNRKVLNRVRGGDYTHAGDREAVNRVIRRVNELLPVKGRCLDIGSGFGGTAADFYRNGFKEVYGVDRDAAAIAYAKEHYPEVDFTTADAHDVSKLFKSDFFSLIYMFNVFYAIEDKKALLEEMARVAEPDALLVIFDYTALRSDFAMKDLAGKAMYPVRLEKDLQGTRWKVIETQDLTSQFIIWYERLIIQLKDYPELQATFKTLLGHLQNGSLGGVVVYARLE